VADPSTQHLERLAQFYGVTLDVLWKGGTEAELIAANEGEVEAVTSAEVGTGTREAEGLSQGHTVEARLAVAQAELRFLREKVADLRRDRDAWRALAERLAGKLGHPRG
jgi:hypothetical protein